jgi:fructosamine-3-kinase
MFAAEALGLDWLRQANALRIPEVVAAGAEFLALEYLESAPRAANFEESLGRGLAHLHRSGAPHHGLDHDNFIGPLSQRNAPTTDWAQFYTECRLRPQVAMAQTMGRAGADWEKRFDRLYSALPHLLPNEPPSRLHGDLWGGNLLSGPDGKPCLVDPAAYAGHREVDLAMMRLFGGFGRQVFEAYEAEYPLLEGHQHRVHLYQLYPLLVHVNLFGGGYRQAVERALQALDPLIL